MKLVFPSNLKDFHYYLVYNKEQKRLSVRQKVPPRDDYTSIYWKLVSGCVVRF